MENEKIISHPLLILTYLSLTLTLIFSFNLSLSFHSLKKPRYQTTPNLNYSPFHYLSIISLFAFCLCFFFFFLSLARDFEFFVRGRFVRLLRRTSACFLWFPFIS